MQITIGQYQIENLKKRNVDQDQLINFLRDLLNITPESHKNYPILEKLIYKYMILNRSTFICTGNGTLEYHMKVRDQVISLVEDLLKDPEYKDKRNYLEVIKENYEITDKLIEGKLAKRVFKLFSEPS